ncbi:hypothetical protein ABT56_22100 [Photobacterium aquae]|uniref:G domain-containing protein n=1 Tax=Photobacterium aquae TaxID=1195763 RepID=A0A0J1GPU7_9GAMM|nr:GTPase [Photobacterium aquae]KLV01454.1 hypothetical protein ABT56_22100 [Photobacterium aquae]
MNPYQPACDALGHIQTLLAKSKVHAQYLPLISEWQDQLVRQMPTVMLYGNYNAGKSSLINLLVGDTVATEGEIPTTARVHTYHWQGMPLLDTPGINAPMAHEHISQQQLAKTDLVLFVIRNSDVDDADIYRQLSRLIANNKSVFVVLNCESSKPEDISLFHRQLMDHLFTELPQMGVSDSQIELLPVLPLNIRTAILAQQQQQPELLKYSGYLSLAAELAHWLEVHKQHHWLGSLYTRMEQQLFEPLLSQQQTGNDALFTMSAHIDYLSQRKALLKRSGAAKVGSLVAARRVDMHSALEQSESLALLSQIQADISEQAAQWLQQQLDLVEQVLLYGDSTFASITEPKQNTSNELINQMQLQMGNCLKRADKKHISALLSTLKKADLPLFRQLSAKQIGQAAKYGGPALQALSAVWNLYQGYASQGRENEQARQAATVIARQLTQLSAQISRSLTQQLHQFIDDAFSPRIKCAVAKKETYQAELGEEQLFQQELSEWRNELRLLCLKPAEADKMA